MSKLGQSQEDEKDGPFNPNSYLEKINRWVFVAECIHKRRNFAALLIQRCHEMDN
jgi:hypothetical protein